MFKFLVLLFLIFFISSYCSASLFSWFKKSDECYAYYKEEDVVRYEHPFAYNGVLDIENTAGSIEIKGGEEHKIIVLAKKRATSLHALTRLVIRADLNEKKSIIKTEMNTGLFKGATKAIVDYTIVVPKSAHLVVSCGAGIITIKDIHGSVQANSGAGTTTLENVSGRLGVESGSGTIAISCADEKLSTVKARSAAGTITIENANGSVEASSTTGTVWIQQTKFLTDAVINAQTTVGSISLVLPAQVQAQLDVASTMGSIQSDFTIIESPQTHRGWFTKNIKGTIGTGGGHILLQTNLGSITLAKR